MAFTGEGFVHPSQPWTLPHERKGFNVCLERKNEEITSPYLTTRKLAGTSSFVPAQESKSKNTSCTVAYDDNIAHGNKAPT